MVYMLTGKPKFFKNMVIPWENNYLISIISEIGDDNSIIYKITNNVNGLENFSIEQIDTAEDFKELGRLERKYIKEYDSQNPDKGYNLTAGGESNQWDANPAAKLLLMKLFKLEKYTLWVN